MLIIGLLGSVNLNFFNSDDLVMVITIVALAKANKIKFIIILPELFKGFPEVATLFA